MIGNGKFYGGPFEIFPRADLRDGLLDVCVLPRVNWPALLRCAPGFLARRKLPEKLARRFRAAAFELSGDAAAAFELDGELAGKFAREIFSGTRPSACRLLKRPSPFRSGAAAFARHNLAQPSSGWLAEPRLAAQRRAKAGGLAGTRTLDQCLKRALLYQLSYQPILL